METGPLRKIASARRCDCVLSTGPSLSRRLPKHCSPAMSHNGWNWRNAPSTGGQSISVRSSASLSAALRRNKFRRLSISSMTHFQPDREGVEILYEACAKRCPPEQLAGLCRTRAELAETEAMKLSGPNAAELWLWAQHLYAGLGDGSRASLLRPQRDAERSEQLPRPLSTRRVFVGTKDVCRSRIGIGMVPAAKAGGRNIWNPAPRKPSKPGLTRSARCRLRREKIDC